MDTASTVMRGALSAGWERSSISSFGYTTYSIMFAPLQHKLIQDFTNKYFDKDWSERYIDIESHKRLVNVLLRMSVSSTIMPVPLSITDVLLKCVAARTDLQM